jgi:hypothetical protein
MDMRAIGRGAALKIRNTGVIPVVAPRCLGSAAMVCTASAAHAKQGVVDDCLGLQRDAAAIGTSLLRSGMA